MQIFGPAVGGSVAGGRRVRPGVETLRCRISIPRQPEDMEMPAPPLCGLGKCAVPVWNRPPQERWDAKVLT